MAPRRNLAVVPGGKGSNPPVPRRSASPFSVMGVGGTPMHFGWIDYGERDWKLLGNQRHKTIADMVANVSIIGAGLRYFLNLCAKPNWSVEPAETIEGEISPEAQEAADFVEECLYDMEFSWTRIVRRAAAFSFHGYGLQEWIAKQRDDGQIGFLNIEPRPQHTISRWDTYDDGKVRGVFQRNPQTAQEIYLPIEKLIYLVDDTLSDSPEGLGLFRHLHRPASALKRYEQLEGQGFERDLRGIPVGRVPYTAIERAVQSNQITRAKADAMIKVMEDFVQIQVTEKNTGMVLDSQPYESAGAQGMQAGATPMWGIELLTGGASSLADMHTAINRKMEECARILGVEGLLMGSEQAGGNRALGKDKSQNLYLVVNSALGVIAEGMEKGVIDVLWLLNGFDPELKPTLKNEDVAFKDVEQITAALRDMATAGAVLQPDDPAINDVRDIIGISRQPDPDPALLGAIDRARAGLPGEPEDPLDDEPPPGQPPTKKGVRKGDNPGKKKPKAGRSMRRRRRRGVLLREKV